MKKVIGFAGSNSAESINAALVSHVLSKLNTVTQKYIALTEFEIPMYSIDTEQASGIPIDIQLLKNEIAKADGLVLSVNEHNGAWSAFFKNTFDWLSRADRNFLQDTKVLLMSTSPGARGASSALEYAKQTLPRFGAQVVESFSFPSFQENFDSETGAISDPALQMGVQEVIASFLNELDA
jgi:NAD(P)H-dependent FMN reductase